MTGKAADAQTIEDQIANFDPADPDALAKLEQSILDPEGDDTGTDDAGSDEELAETTDASPAEGGEKEAKQDEKQQAAEPAAEVATSGDQKPEGVLTKDGKHVIPYNVLERERERASRAEQTIKELEARLQQSAAGDPNGAADKGAVDISQDDLDELEQEIPEVAKVIKHLMGKLNEATGVITQLRDEQERTKQVRAQEEADEFEAAINSTSHLKGWRDKAFSKEAPDRTMWDRAVKVDSMLREDPEWSDKPYSERLAQVEKTVTAMYGMNVAPPKTDKQPDLKTVADEKLKGKGGDVPTSLSDIPGGNPPAQGYAETLENASTVALGQKFLNMTVEQQEAYLARFGGV